MEGLKLNIRLIALSVLVLVMVTALGGRLYNMQIVNGAVYAMESERKLTRSITLPFSRGEILDRYGRPLVTNRLTYAVTIDEKRMLLQKDTDWAGILRGLIELTEKSGSKYEDLFPVSKQAPFRYTAPMSAVQRSRLDKFLAAKHKETSKKGWDKEMTADELMKKLREDYKLPEDYSDEDARLVIGVRYEIELRRLAPSVPPYTFAGDIDMELVTMIKEKNWPGVMIDAVTVRQYQTDVAAHILGRVNKIPEEEYDDYKEKGYAGDETVGVDGAERAFEDWLRGINGLQTEETNTAGRVQDILYTKQPKPGSNVYLTVDIRLQEAAERILAYNIQEMQKSGEHLKGKESEAGAAVVIDVKTGGILAMANYPTYSLKTFSEDYERLREEPLKPMLNRTIAGTYSPGSTYKMVTASAGLGEGIIVPKTTIFDRVVYTYFKDRQPRCTGSHGSINVSQAIQKSCNYFFYDVGLRAGIDNQVKWARLYGLGEPTGVELVGEKVGYNAGPETSKATGQTWYPGNVLSAAIGQGDNAFSPLAIANYVATIANGGSRYKAHLLHEVASYDYSQTIYETPHESVEQIPLDDSAMKAIQLGMRMGAQSGTAAGTFAGYSIPVAAKTGTVQSTADKPNNATFVAYAPYDNPEIAIAVVVEKGGAGSRIAPIARDIFDAYFMLQKEMETPVRENVLQK